jgi:hypothetical protein
VRTAPARAAPAGALRALERSEETLPRGLHVLLVKGAPGSGGARRCRM